jgi:Na+-transporting NADH:ubiquinone oxidoreductase subunit D
MAAGKAMRVFRENMGPGNPVFAQILGICSTLAVTNVVKNTLIMCAGLTFTTALSNVTISALRNIMPGRVRMMAEVMVIAAYVIFFDILLKAFQPDVSRQLGPYVGLIITNCIVMGRAEAFALANPPRLSLIDGFTSGLGYSYVLLIIAFFRELIGSGSLWGVKVLGEGWVNWTFLIMAPGGFFALAILVWIVKGWVLFKPHVQEAKP